MSFDEGRAIVRKWLEDREIAVALRRLKPFLALASPALRVYGAGEPLDHAQWAARVRRAWQAGRFAALQHEDLRIQTLAARRIAFSVQERTTAADGRTSACAKRIMLEREADGQWRAVEETLSGAAQAIAGAEST